MFTQDVLREVRNLKSSSSLADRLRNWFSLPRLAFAGGLAALAIAVVMTSLPEAPPTQTVEVPPTPEIALKTEVVDELEAKVSELEYFEDLIAEDVAGLDEDELVALLY